MEDIEQKKIDSKEEKKKVSSQNFSITKLAWKETEEQKKILDVITKMATERQRKRKIRCNRNKRKKNL